MSDKTLYTIIVHSENIAGLLNQVTAVFTRRQINAGTFRAGPPASALRPRPRRRCVKNAY